MFPCAVNEGSVCYYLFDRLPCQQSQKAVNTSRKSTSYNKYTRLALLGRPGKQGLALVQAQMGWEQVLTFEAGVQGLEWWAAGPLHAACLTCC